MRGQVVSRLEVRFAKRLLGLDTPKMSAAPIGRELSENRTVALLTDNFTLLFDPSVREVTWVVHKLEFGKGATIDVSAPQTPIAPAPSGMDGLVQPIPGAPGTSGGAGRPGTSGLDGISLLCRLRQWLHVGISGLEPMVLGVVPAGGVGMGRWEETRVVAVWVCPMSKVAGVELVAQEGWVDLAGTQLASNLGCMDLMAYPIRSRKRALTSVADLSGLKI